jgi:hypothetical protein
LPSPQKRPIPSTLPPASQARARLIRQGWRFKTAAPEAAEEAQEDPTATSQVEQAAEALQESKGPGRPLPPETRHSVEQALGRDFSQVRVQTARLAPLNVEAATHGAQVYVEPGQETFETPQARAVLSHELTHVAQRGLAPTKPPAEGETIEQVHQTVQTVQKEEAEADRNEQRFLKSQLIQAQPNSSAQPIFRKAAAVTAPRPSHTSGSETIPAPLVGWLSDQAREQRYPLASPPQMVARQAAEPAEAAPAEMEPDAERQAADQENEETEQKAADGLDLDQLARQIYPLLKRMIAVERERRPDYRDFSLR